MRVLSLLLLLNGIAVLSVSAASGLILWRVLAKNENGADWHLVHASGTARGILLIALAPVTSLLVLPVSLATLAVCLLILFVWCSLTAMLVRASSGSKGFDHRGSLSNRIGFGLYAIGVVALFPGLAILFLGFAMAL
ncbi:MAG: hypothetical protein KDK07_17815 [Bauldia sp.]|nr:hypothetical protein [Bauldia sp.]